MPKTLFRAVIWLCLLAAGSLMKGAEPMPPLVTALQGTPSSIDGDLRDAVWQGPGWHTGFTALGTGEPADAETRFKVALDARNLYFAVECFEPRPDEVVADCRQHDGPVFADDCVEIFLGLSADIRTYVHLAINSLGTLCDAEYDAAGRRNTGWHCEGSAAARPRPDAWTVECAVPLYQLNLSLDGVTSYRLNVGRQRKAGRRQLSSFAPLSGGYHNSAKFASLRLPDLDLSTYNWAIMPIFGRHVVANTLHARTRITNQSGAFHPATSSVQLALGTQTQNGEVLRDMLDQGQTHECEFSVPLPGNGAQVLSLTIRDAVDRRPLAQRVAPLTLHYAPIEITMRKPFWRNSICSSQVLTTVEFHAEFLLEPQELANLTARLSVVPAAAGDSAPIATAERDKLPRELDVTLAVGDLAVGDYALRVMLLDSEGNTRHQATRPLRKLPPPPSGVEWWFTEDRVLMRNAEPFLPYGAYQLYPDRMAQLKGVYNAALWYAVPGLRDYFAAAADNGVAVVAYPYPHQETKQTKGEWSRLLNDEEIRALQEHVRSFQDTPGVLCWYLADEPGHDHVPRMLQTRDILNAADPYRPTIILLNNIDAIHRFAGSADIIMSDPYPGFKRNGRGALPIETVSAFMKAAQKASRGKVPVWVTLQGFNWGYTNRPGERYPNVTEARNMNYQAVIYGATGFLWYGDGYMAMSPHLAIGVPFIAREMQLLKRHVLGADVTEQVRVRAAIPAHLHVALRRTNGSFVLFAVNTATTEQRVSFEFNGQDVAEVAVVSENRRIALDGNVLTDDFGVYATHIYTDLGKLADTLDLRATRDAARAADAARRKPGNLAFEETGVAVTAPGISDASGVPCWLGTLTDGITDRDRGGGLYLGHVRSTPVCVDLEWPAEQRISRLVLYNYGLDLALEVQVPARDGRWTTLPADVRTAAPTIEVRFEPVTTRIVRARFTRFAADAAAPVARPRVAEIEAYADADQ